MREQNYQAEDKLESIYLAPKEQYFSRVSLIKLFLIMLILFGSGYVLMSIIL